MSAKGNFGDVGGGVTATSWLERVTLDTDCIVFVFEEGKDSVMTGGPFNSPGANMRRDSDGTDTLV